MTSQQIPPDAPDTSAPQRQDDDTDSNLASVSKTGSLLLWPGVVLLGVALVLILYFIFR